MFRCGFIMAGGRGRRLYPLTAAIPKPLLPIGEKPIIQLIIERMRGHGIDEVFISVNYKKEMIKNFLGDGSRYGLTVRYIEEPVESGTAGSLALLPEGFAEDMLVSNGDLVCDVDYSAIKAMLQRFDLVLTGIERTLSVDFGVLRVTDGSGLAGWEEKPVLKHIINGGVYGVSRRAYELCRELYPDRARIDMPDLWRAMAERSMKTGVHIHRGRWHDVGRMEDYMALTEGGEDRE